MTGFAEVSDTLWRERELLDLLLFKLDSERLLLRAGSIRWLARSTHEVDLVLEQLQLVEITRALEVDDLAAQLACHRAPRCPISPPSPPRPGLSCSTLTGPLSAP